MSNDHRQIAPARHGTGSSAKGTAHTAGRDADHHSEQPLRPDFTTTPFGRCGLLDPARRVRGTPDQDGLRG